MRLIWYLSTIILLNTCEVVIARGPQWGFITNADQAESMCLDGTQFGSDLEKFRAECDLSAATSRLNENDELEIDWTTECSTLQMLFDGCNSDFEDEEERQSQCTTTTGETCTFPFTYGGKTYNECTTDSADDYWCATGSSSWGYCDKTNAACGIPNSGGGGSGNGGLPPPVQKPDRDGICMTTYPAGQLACDFPYEYKGTAYDGCTGKDSTLMWCSYKNDTSGNAKWWAWCQDDCFMVNDDNEVIQPGKGMPKALLTSTLAPSTAAPTTAAPTTAASQPSSCTCPSAPTCPTPPSNAEPKSDAMCVLKKLKWVTGSGKNAKFEMNAMINYVKKKLDRANVKKALLKAITKCKTTKNQKKYTTKVTGPYAGFGSSVKLGCIERVFNEWCVNYIKSYTAFLSKAK